jgi:outer membrane protein OmpA-like peptidoglycan-associated protein
MSMMVRSTVVVAALCALLSHNSFAQVAPSPPQQPTNEASVPIYRITVVGRTTPAINYRRSGDTKVDLNGTALLPDARGVAEISPKNGHTEIDARFSGMQRATRFGSEYLTYVLWAITPEGRPRNLGELQFTGDELRKQVTTELQAFALIVTAEPYFAVTQPSDLVVIENSVRADTRGKAETVQAKYELLPRGSYLMNRPAEFTNKSLDAGVPLDLAEAHNALELARLAGADRYAADTFTKATRLLAEAEVARQKGRSKNDVMASARQSAQTSEDARLIAVTRQDVEFTAQQKALADDRGRQAFEQRLRADREELKAAKAQADAEREAQAAVQAKADAERETLNAVRATAEAERERTDTARVRDELQQARLEALKAQAAVAVAEQEKNALREQLREQLNMFLETRESARGLIMMVPDVLFETSSARLTAAAREKLARVSGILAAQPDLHISIEGHTDNRGSAEGNQRLSEQRARSVFSYLAQQQIPTAAMDVAAFGETRPVAINDTTAGRQQNRRVEIVVSGESIGTAPHADTPQ